MEMQQMIKCLLAGQEEMLVRMQEIMNANMKTMQDKADANRKADQQDLKERMDANTKAVQEKLERQIGSLLSVIEANRRTDRDEMKQEIRASQEHIKEIIETQFASLATKLDDWQKEMQTDREASKIMDWKANLEDMESELEYQEIPKGEATVVPVGGLRKRHRVRNLASEHRQKPKESTRWYCGS
jgi:hypothetical protein